MSQKIKKNAVKKCISEIAKKPTVINPLTVAYNMNGKPSLVLDCLSINEKLHQFKFKYENMKVARNMFEKGAYMFGFDIKGAYSHIFLTCLRPTMLI